MCCLSSVNLETWDEWSDAAGLRRRRAAHARQRADALHRRSRPTAWSARATRRCANARSGLGVMGFHSFLQAERHSVRERAGAVVEPAHVPQDLRARPMRRRVALAEERGACPDAAERGVMERFSHKLAIAPTASISIICGGTSACIEPIPANIYTHKTLSGSFSVRNRAPAEDARGARAPTRRATWQSILEHEGSVQHLDVLERATRRRCSAPRSRSTSAGSIELAADRAPLHLPGPVAEPLSARPTSTSGICSCCTGRRGSAASRASTTAAPSPMQRAGFAGVEGDNTRAGRERRLEARTDYDECLACQ